MVRHYKRKRSKNYNETDLEKAVSAAKDGLSYREAGLLFNIPVTTLHNHVKEKHTSTVGHPPALTKEEEKLIVSSLVYCAKNGYPCDKKDVVNMVEDYSSKCPRRFP